MPPLFISYHITAQVTAFADGIVVACADAHGAPHATDGCKTKKLQKQLATPGSAPYNTELLRAEGSDANEVR